LEVGIGSLPRQERPSGREAEGSRLPVAPGAELDETRFSATAFLQASAMAWWQYQDAPDRDAVGNK